MIQLLRLVEHEPDQWTRARLVEHFGVSPRMIDRDVELLRGPVYDLRRRYRQGHQLRDRPEWDPAGLLRPMGRVW